MALDGSASLVEAAAPSADASPASMDALADPSLANRRPSVVMSTSSADGASHAALALQRSLKGKEKEWSAVAEKKRPLQLLDLPVDILAEIVRHLPHANDVTSLALCHSSLHALAIPHIYSRFDIVWPDQGMQTDSRAGVDALTYGLATLVKGQEVFGEAAFQRDNKQMRPHGLRGPAKSYPYPLRRRRLGNYYARYTKKFSLGNGPSECVREYLITKEGGKMLGTLVALAIARMPNLEAFIWDMPTGVLRDVWLALSSLADLEEEDQSCRLENVWVRWHNNWQPEPNDPPPPPPPNLGAMVPATVAQNTTSALHGHMGPGILLNSGAPIPTMDRVEHPTFSVLPPLKCLTVLEIDELVYLDEMSILIARSQHCLKTLRVGIASHTRVLPWTTNYEGEKWRQVDYDTEWTIASKIGEQRLQGVLGVLVGRVFNLHNNENTPKQGKGAMATRNNSAEESTIAQTSNFSSLPNETTTALSQTDPNTSPNAETAPSPESGSRNTSGGSQTTPQIRECSSLKESPSEQAHLDGKYGPCLSGKLKLEVLELERVTLSIPVLQSALDWSTLTGLTLLNCQNHETFWRILARKFSPVVRYYTQPADPTQPRQANYSHVGYNLNLKQIHTNTVSQALIRVIKETLAPNSLELLFLQDVRRSEVSIQQIFNNAIRKHHSSLRKLLIDSSDDSLGDFPDPGTRWKEWKFNRTMVKYVTCGKMKNLRELGLSLDYADWHYFLQRLPKVSHLRSMYIPHIADHPHGANIDPQELAMQVLDIVTLRPEIELCYMGIGTKCFEILENRSVSFNSATPNGVVIQDALLGNAGHGSAGSSDDSSDEAPGDEDDDEDDDGDGDDVDDDDEVGGGMGGDGGVEDDADDTDDQASVLSDVLSDLDEVAPTGKEKRNPKLRLQEILFYDKVSIFRARHGRL